MWDIILAGCRFIGAEWFLQDVTDNSTKRVSEEKTKVMLPECMNKTYKIVIIVNEAWKHSFSRVEYNKKSIAVRGWCPFTRNLLDHPEVAATKVQSSDNEATMDSQSTAASSKNQQSVAAVLNYQSGFVNILLSDILQNINHDAIRERIRSNQEKGHMQSMPSAMQRS